MRKPPRRRRRRTEAEITAALARYRRSGLSRRAFARAEGISVTTLGNWLRRPRQRGDSQPPPEPTAAPSRLLPVSMPVVAFGPADFELVLTDGRRLCIPADFEPAALGRLLQVLEPC